MGPFNIIGGWIGSSGKGNKADHSYSVIWQAVWKGLVRTRVKVFLATSSSNKSPSAGAYRYPSLTKGRRDLCCPALVCSCISKGNLSTRTHLHLLPVASIPLIHIHDLRSLSSSTFSVINPYANSYIPLQGTPLQQHFLLFHCPMPILACTTIPDAHGVIYIKYWLPLKPCLLPKYLLYRIF